MKTVIKRTQRDYSYAFKLSVVDQIEKGEMTYKQAQNRYGIQGRSTVLVWLRKYGKLNWTNAAIQKGESEMADPSELTPEQRIKELEQQLYAAQRKAELFETIIDILKKDYGVSVVKKPLHKALLKRKR